MNRSHSTRLLSLVLLLLFAGILISCDLFGGDDEPGELEQVRQATERYQDLSAAEADGFEQFSPPVPNMGVHFLTGTAISGNGTSALDENFSRRDPEILLYADTSQTASNDQLVGVEYAIPKEGETPPDEAVALFSEASAEAWHVHPSRHDLGLEEGWTIHGECHYEGGIGVFLGEDPEGNFVRLTPQGSAGTWGGTVEPGACPTSLGEQELPPLNIVHGKWWTLHAWIWFDNPEGVFNPTNPRVGS